MIKLVKVSPAMQAIFAELVEESLSEMPPDPFQTSQDSVAWLVFLDNEPIGYASCHSIDWVSRRGRGGTWVKAEARGNGVGKEATRLLHECVFGELNLRRMEGAVESSNHPQRHILESLGMKYEGELQDATWFAGKYRTYSIYALVRKEVS